MSVPVFVGDEVSATGYRLAGLRVRVPGEDDLYDTIREVCHHAPLVLISAEVAQRLPPDQLDACLARITPPVVIVPDVRGYTPVPDLATRLRRQLGVLE